VKSLRTKLNADVDVVSVPNGAYRSFKETVICGEASGKEKKQCHVY
jgi:hypothetical protein